MTKFITMPIRTNLSKSLSLKNSKAILIFLVLAGLLARLSLAFLPSFKFDMDAWLAWAARINQVGFAKFYSDTIWTNYTPGFLYVLYLIGPVANSLLIKLPAILSEIILAILSFKIISKKSLKWGYASSAAILFNPAFIFNSSVWGQIDGLLSLFMILSVYLIDKKKLIYSSIFFGLAFLIKPQAIGLFPVFVLFLLKDYSFKKLLKFIFSVLTTIYLLSVPFFTNNPLGIIKLFSKMIGDYSYTSLFAYNLWGVVGFWINDNMFWNNLSYHQLGYLIYGTYWIMISYLFLKGKLSLYSLAALAMLSFFFLPTRVHERYLYPGLIFLIFLAGYDKLKILFILSSILSLLHFLNLYYVYIYFNEIYLKLPKILYNLFLYNLLDNHGRILSFISTSIFIIITYYVFKKAYR